jgi:hypothetical protein
VAEKHGWPEPLAWPLALEGKEDLERFKELGWGLRTWDVWDWNGCDKRFSAVVVSAMQKRKILGVTSRYVIILSQHT